MKRNENLFFSTTAIFLMSAASICMAQATHTETTGSYSGLFVAHESFQNAVKFNPPDGSSSRVEHEVFLTTLIAMYPGKIFGFGLEAPYLHRTIRVAGTHRDTQKLGYDKFGDLRLVAKYQFGVYRRVYFFGHEHLLNMLVSLVGKLKLPTGATGLRDPQGKKLPPFLQPGTGSTDLTLGFVLHTDTEKYFRIYAHLTATLPIAHREFSPGKRVHFTVSYLLARLGINDRYFPFVALKGWWKGTDTLNGYPLAGSSGMHLYLSPGFRSAWWYFPDQRMFVMVETGVQVKAFESANTMNGPSLGFYLGTRIFFR